MFTGIIEDLAVLHSREDDSSNVHALQIKSRLTPQICIGDSIAHNGVCLTVTEVNPDREIYTTIAVQTTLAKTNLGELQEGEIINIERALKLSDRLHGHLLLGHIDETVTISSIIDLPRKEGLLIRFHSFSKPQYLVDQGCIALDGMSLTISELTCEEFAVTIIPYTKEHTNTQIWQKGRKVNIEYDYLIKSFQRAMMKEKNRVIK